jgi:hypothetical protein
MRKLSKFTLSVLSLLVIIGISSIAVTQNTPAIILSYIMCGIGGYAFGTLLAKKDFEKDLDK